MILGVTGSRSGITKNQVKKLNLFLDQHDIQELHHGDCIGADQTIHNISVNRNINVYIHPPIKRNFRAFCSSDFIYPEKEYLSRNRDIVNCSDIVLGFPSNFESVPKSGTWYTINYTKEIFKKVIIIFPDGSFIVE